MKTFKQLSFGLKIRLHVPMEIEMVPAEIGKDRNFKLQSADTLHLDRMRRDLHHGVLPTGVYDLPEQFLEVGRLRCRSLGSKFETWSPVFDRAKNRGRFAGSL